eukprot:gene19888-26592_t
MAMMLKAGTMLHSRLPAPTAPFMGRPSRLMWTPAPYVRFSCLDERPARPAGAKYPRASSEDVQDLSTFKYVVLGGGNSAGYAAKQFLESGLKPGELAIIGEEPVVSYERPALSKAYLTIDGGPRLPGFHTCVGGGGERQTPDWYKEKGITFMTSTKVTSADVKSKTLCLACGDKVTYEKLIIATGARVIRLTEFETPGAELSGIHYIRNEADAAKLVQAMEVVRAAGGRTPGAEFGGIHYLIDEADGAKLVQAMKADRAAGGRAVVVGGGYIGMEVAAQLASNGIPSTIVMPQNRLLARLFTPELAAFYESYYQNKGVNLCKGQKVTGFSGVAGRVSTVSLEAMDGGAKTELQASLVVVGVGARPNVELFKEQLEMGAMGGIQVNKRCVNSTPCYDGSGAGGGAAGGN